MSDIAISIKNLSKRYKMYNPPSDRLKELFHPIRKKYHSDFWALKDVSFEVKKGETLGIIGQNGSGKSTLLQILCGIIQPTEGEVRVNGRVSAILELGAGFNPEFTGRSNVYMQGALMGFSKEEMDEKIKAIEEFADIGEFFDRPVRTYSSGMFVRLAFSTAVNVEPDILIIDEVLAVGDEAFQRKCYSKIEELKKKGATILFVSHTASLIIGICEKAFSLDHGELLISGEPKMVVANYHKFLFAPADKLNSLRNELRNLQAEKAFSSINELIENEEEHPGLYDASLKPKSTVFYDPQGAVIENPRITTLDGKRVNILSGGKEYIYKYDIRFTEDAYLVRYGMLVKTITGIELGGILSHGFGDGIDFVPKAAIITAEFKFKSIFLPGMYFLNSGVIGVKNGTEVFLHRGIDLESFRVVRNETNLLSGFVDIGHSEPV